MEYVIGALLLASFFGLAVYAVRGGNLMIGMLIIGTLWTVLPLFGNTFATNPDFIAAYPGVTDISFVDAITKVYQSGPEGWGSVLVNVVFGAWFGRVLLETGIADALIRKTVELGGDKPSSSAFCSPSLRQRSSPPCSARAQSLPSASSSCPFS